MSTSILEAFVVTFGMDATGFRRGSDEVESKSKRTRDQVKKTFGEVEDQGRNLGQAIRTVGNEVAGLFLAFTGGSSFASFVTQMMTGAASADRLGQTLGMATGKIMAWRQAMSSVGGSEGSADAALSVMERAVQAYRLTGSTGMDADLIGLGINRADLNQLSPDQLLTKIAGARGRMDGTEFAARLGRIGMPQDMTNFLMQGEGKVQAQISALELNTQGMENAAKNMEDLQGAITGLKSELQSALVPEITKLVKGITDLIKLLPHGFFEDPIAATGGNFWDHAADELEAMGYKGAAKWLHDKAGYYQLGAGVSEGWGDKPVANGPIPPSGSRANRNNNPGNIKDGAFARRQAGYLGSDGTFARFSTPEAGWAAQEALLKGYMAQGRTTIGAIIAKWAPHSENNVAAYAAAIERAMGVSRNAHLGQGQLHMLMAAMAKHEGFRGPQHVHVGRIDVHTQARDAHGIARGIHGALRNRITQSDGGVAP